MKKILDKIAILLSGNTIKHIIIPRDIFTFIILVVFLLFLASFVLWKGIWIIVSLPILLFLSGVVNVFFKIWKKYYATTTFVLILILEISIAFIFAGQIHSWMEKLFV